MTPPPSTPTPTTAARTVPLARVLQFIVSLIVGGACLWFAFRGNGGAGEDGVSAGDISDRLAKVPATTTLLFCALFLGQIFLRTERWRLQVRGLSGITPTWKDALAINAIAFAAVFLLPFRLGEFVRPNLSARRGLMSAAAGLAATAVERVVDGLLATAIFGALLLLSPHDLPTPVRVGGLSALAFFGGACGFFGFAFAFREPALGLLRKMAAFVSERLATRLVDIAGGFLDGLACFGGARGVVVYVALSAGYWVLNGLSMVAVVQAIAPEAPLDAGFFCLSFLVIGVMIPAPPGNVGNFHYFARAGLMLTGVSVADAVAIGVVLHAFTVIGVVSWAALFLAIGGFRMRDFSSAGGASEAARP